MNGADAAAGMRARLMRTRLIQVGEVVPEFTLPASDNTLWRRDDLLRGDRALLVFYRRGCPASRLVLTMTERIARRMSRAPLRIAGIAQDSHADTLEMADAYQITFPLLLDARYALSDSLGVRRTPTQLLLDKEARVVSSLVGFSRREEEQFFLRLARSLDCVEDALFTERDLMPESVEGLPSASPAARAGEGETR